MKGIVLAAGRGSRMQTLTASRPKALLELGGRPLLEWTLAAFRAAGIEEMLVVRGYLAHLLTGPYRTVDNPRWEQSNMVVSLLTADDWLSADNCLVSYADIVYHPEHARALADADGDIAISYDRLWDRLWFDRFDNPLDDAESFRAEDGRLVEIGRPSTDISEITGQYMGLLKFTPNGWRAVRRIVDALPLDEVSRLDMTGLLQRLLDAGVSIRTVPVDGRWCEVDSADDLQTYQRRLADADTRGLSWTHDWRP